MSHEIWHTCPDCGFEYDMHLDWFVCPNCGFDEDDTTSEASDEEDEA